MIKLNLPHTANYIQFISLSDYRPSLVLACEQAHWLWPFPAAAVIAAVVLVVAAAYPDAAYPETPDDLVAMPADLASAHLHHHPVEAACACRLDYL
jgi:hypothetical protein